MNNPAKITNDSYQNVNIIMWQVIKQMYRIKKHDLEQFGLTCSQFEIMSAIYQISKTREEIIQINLSEKNSDRPHDYFHHTTKPTTQRFNNKRT